MDRRQRAMMDLDEVAHGVFLMILRLLEED